MSADNWAVCPRCLKREKARIANLKAEAKASYGTLPINEFEALRARATEPINPEKFHTFREDYEFYGAEEGAVTATYRGSCTKCGLALSFKVVKEIPGVDG